MNPENETIGVLLNRNNKNLSKGAQVEKVDFQGTIPFLGVFGEGRLG